MADRPKYTDPLSESQEGNPFTKTPNGFYDELLAQIDSICELKVTLAIIRLTCGHHKDEDVISYSQLESITGLTRPSVCLGVKAALNRGCVGRRKRGNSYSYWLSVGSSERLLVARDYQYLETTNGSERLPVNGSERLPTKERERNTTNLSNSEEIRCRSHEESQGEDDVAEKVAPQLFYKLQAKGWKPDFDDTMEFFRWRKSRYSIPEVESATSRMCVALATGYPIKTDHKRFFDNLLTKPWWKPKGAEYEVVELVETLPVVNRERTDEECLEGINKFRRDAGAPLETPVGQGERYA